MILAFPSICVGYIYNLNGKSSSERESHQEICLISHKHIHFYYRETMFKYQFLIVQKGEISVEVTNNYFALITAI